MPFVGKGTDLIIENEDGEWETSENVEEVLYGFEKEDWQGVPWAPLNVFWTKRPAYVIEVHPKDPYYNYGTQYIWVDAENWCPLHKIINDRANAFWKLSFHAQLNYESRDKKVKISSAGNQIVVDERSNRSTVSLPATRKNIWTTMPRWTETPFPWRDFKNSVSRTESRKRRPSLSLQETRRGYPWAGEVDLCSSLLRNSGCYVHPRRRGLLRRSEEEDPGGNR